MASTCTIPGGSLIPANFIENVPCMDQEKPVGIRLHVSYVYGPECNALKYDAKTCDAIKCIPIVGKVKTLWRSVR